MNNLLLGAIVGDIFGQPYEFKKSRQNSLCFDLFENKGKFTDDTVCTIGVAEAIIHNPKNPDFTTLYQSGVVSIHMLDTVNYLKNG